MAHDFAQRRRVALAMAITVIAVPAAFLLNRSSGDAEPTTAGTVETLVGTVAPPAAASPPAVAGQPSRTDDTDALGTVAGGLPVGHHRSWRRSARPDRRAAPARVGQGTRHVQQRRSTRPCSVTPTPEVPFNATITVTNLDNSRSVQCVSSIGGAPARDDVVLATDTFAQIADLTDAPVPVQITWTSK